MFSNLGQIFGVRPREAESTDTRLGIRRQDPDQQRRQDNGEAEPETLFDTDDSATVSVHALRLFLDNFLKATNIPGGIERRKNPRNAKSSDNTKDNSDTGRFSFEDSPKPVSSSQAGMAAQAASAYQSTAQNSYFSDLAEQNALDNAPHQPPLPFDLEAEDVRLIYKLLADLKILGERRIEYVRIEKSDSFLHSLADGVNRALGQ